MADIKILDLEEATEITETTDYIPVVDTSDTAQDSTGTTKKATVRKLLGDRVLPDTIVGTTETQTLTNKTLTSPTINTPTGDIVTPTGIQTLTNKALTGPKINEDVALTATSTELNNLDGLTANATELNLLDNQTVLRKQNISGNSYGTAVLAGETKYIGHGLGVSAYTVGFVFACAGTIKNLYVYSGGAPGADQTYTCTLMKDNVAQSVTCTITNSDGNLKSDTSHSFTVAAGNRVSLRFVCSAGAASTIAQFAFEFDPS